MKGEGVDKVREALEKVTHMLARYVSEVPLGHQPRMAALEAEALVREAREALSAQPAESAWLIEWRAHGLGPQWWGFNYEPGRHGMWCSDANNAIRFSRREDAERMRLHVIAARGLTGQHTYEQQVTVTEHEWPADTPAAPQPAPSKPAAWVACAERMPASGVTVLACYTNSAGNVRRIRAEWVAAKTIESDADSEISEYDEATDCYYDPEGWYEKIDNWDDYSSVAVVEGEITHWMPLPAAPHPAAKGAES